MKFERVVAETKSERLVVRVMGFGRGAPRVCVDREVRAESPRGEYWLSDPTARIGIEPAEVLPLIEALRGALEASQA